MTHLTTPAWAAFCAADDAWAAELHRTFGKKAGDARYTSKGSSGTPALAALYATREAARLAVESVRNAA